MNILLIKIAGKKGGIKYYTIGKGFNKNRSRAYTIISDEMK